nr:6551_t:CDS:2 [Entrophospora candida]
MTTLQEQFEKDFPDKEVVVIDADVKYGDDAKHGSRNFTNYDLDLREYKNVKDLNLSGNDLTSINLSECKKLKHLRLASNKLTSAEFLNQLPNPEKLEDLFLLANKIQPTNISIFIQDLKTKIQETKTELERVKTQESEKAAKIERLKTSLQRLEQIKTRLETELAQEQQQHNQTKTNFRSQLRDLATILFPSNSDIRNISFSDLKEQAEKACGNREFNYPRRAKNLSLLPRRNETEHKKLTNLLKLPQVEKEKNKFEKKKEELNQLITRTKSKLNRAESYLLEQILAENLNLEKLTELQIALSDHLEIELILTKKQEINGKIFAEGPLGKKELTIPHQLEITNKEGNLFTKSENTALAGTYNSLISNLIEGVVKGYEDIAEVKGVGFKVTLKEKKIEFSLGKSHLIYVDIPEDLEVKVERNKITVKGLDKQKVRNFIANKIRPLHVPSVYRTSKGSKGIYYPDEEKTIKLKEGNLSKLGIENCLSLLGTNLSEEQVKLIAELKKTIVLFLDNDKAGQEATINIAVKLLLKEIDCEIVRNNYKGDPDEICRQQDKKVVENILCQRENPYLFILNYCFDKWEVQDNPQRVSRFIVEIARIFQNFKVNVRSFLVEKISHLIK